MPRFARRLFARPVAPAVRPKTKLRVTELERRDTPATFDVMLLSPSAGDPGDTAAVHTGGLTIGSNSLGATTTVEVTADSATLAVEAVLSGMVEVRVGDLSASYSFSLATAGTAADKRPFLVSLPDGQTGEVRLEDLAGQPNCDWDYNDRSWGVRVVQTDDGGGTGPVTNYTPGPSGGTGTQADPWVWQDANTAEKVKVWLAVTDEVGDYLRWTYTVTNVSVSVQFADNCPGLHGFSLPGSDTTNVTDLQQSIGWDPSVSGGTIAWAAPRAELPPYLAIGQTATFSFRTHQQPKGPSTGGVIIAGRPVYGDEAGNPVLVAIITPSLHVSGPVEVPAVLPTVSIQADSYIPVNANNDNFKLEIDADTGQAENEADRWLSMDQPFIPKVRDFTVSQKIAKKDPQLIPVIISVTGTDKAGLLKASVARKGQGDARLFKEQDKDGGLFASVELPITDPATGTKLWSKTVYIEGVHESAALKDLAIEASFKQDQSTAKATPKDTTVTPVIMSLETKAGEVFTLDDPETKAWIGVQAGGKAQGGGFIPGVKMTADVVNESAVGTLDVAYVQDMTDTSGPVDGGPALILDNGQKSSFRIAPAYANDPDPSKRATYPLLDASPPGTNPIYNSGPDDPRPEVVSADPSRVKVFLTDSPAWVWPVALDGHIKKLDRRKSFHTYLVVRYTDGSLYPLAYTTWAFTVYADPAVPNKKSEVIADEWVKPKNDPPAKTRPPVANTTYTEGGAIRPLIQQYLV